ncbi:MAG: hypothetical protein IPM01_24455 [Burkholderiaceae bacterium]|nr:hypothetical protein [Burkholderiaceae bacterium]
MKKFLTVASLAVALGTLMASASFAADGAKVYASTCASAMRAGCQAPAFRRQGRLGRATGAGVDAGRDRGERQRGDAPKAGNVCWPTLTLKRLSSTCWLPVK